MSNAKGISKAPGTNINSRFSSFPPCLIKASFAPSTNLSVIIWLNLPLITAIFSLPFNLEGDGGSQSTYVISGDQTWYINPSNDKLIRQKNIDERFSSLNVLLESPTIPVSSPTTASS